MLSAGEDFVVVISIVAGALLFAAVLNRAWPAMQRRQHNDLIGWQLSILGTTYAVMLGFMLYTVWTNYGLADLNADAEANALVNVFQLASGLPPVQGQQVQQLTRKYADVVVNQDWPTMARGDTPTASGDVNAELWRTLMTVKGANPVELTAEDHALYELSALAEHRRIRKLETTARLPQVLWSVLMIGAAVTILSSCMFGTGSRFLHMLQIGAFSLLIALVLVAIGDIDRPFQGAVHVSDAAFRRAQENMR